MPDEILWVIEKKIELAKELKDSELVSKFYIGKADYHSHRGEYRLAMQYAENAFKEAQKNQNINLMVQSSWSLCLAYSPAGEFTKIISIVPEVLELIEKKERKSDFFSFPMTPYSLLSAYCGAASGNLGLFQKSTEIFNKGIAHALDISDNLIIPPLEIGYGYMLSQKGEWESAIKHLQKGILWFFWASLNAFSAYCIGYGYMLSQKGEWESAIKHLQKGILSSQEMNYSWFEGFGYCIIGYATSMLGNHDEGYEYVKKGVEMHESSGVAMWLPMSYCRAGAAMKEIGDFKLAKKYLEESLKSAIKSNETGVKGHSKILLGSLLWKINTSQKSEALDCLKEGITILENIKLKPLLALGYLHKGELYLDNKEPEKAIENLKTAESMLREMRMDFWLNKTQAVINGIHKN